MEVEEALILLNDWWLSGSLRQGLAKEYKLSAFGKAYKRFTTYKEIVVLTGLRRVGKTTIIYQIIDELLKHVEQRHIIYFTFDYVQSTITSILDAYKKLTGVDWKKEKIYVFLDEIQKQESWAEELKMLYDAFPNIKFFVSGSAAMQLEKKAMESLAGRHFLIDVPVLSLVEYYSLKYGKHVDDSNLRLNYSDIALELDSYIKKPFPELVGIQDDATVYEYIRENIAAKVISQDLVKEFKKVNVTLLNSLLEQFFAEPGMILNVDSLSKALVKRKSEVERHIYMLEFSKLIRILKNYRPSARSESRKLRKVYPYDISLALAYYPNLEKGKIFETLVISKLSAKRYWREGSKEIDAILTDAGVMLPVEVKSSTVLKTDYVKALDYFIEHFKAKYGILAYNGKSAVAGKIKALNITDILIYGDKIL
ncbi:MAG: ATP-binding protein [Candidatus Micrarchaeaceae archaeon]